MSKRDKKKDGDELAPQRLTRDTESDATPQKEEAPSVSMEQLLVAISGLTETVGSISSRLDEVEAQDTSKPTRPPTLSSAMLRLPKELPTQPEDPQAGLTLEEMALPQNIASIPDHVLQGKLRETRSSFPNLPHLCDDVDDNDPTNERRGKEYEYKWTVSHRGDDRLLKRVREHWKPIELAEGVNKTELIPIRRALSDPLGRLEREQARRRSEKPPAPSMPPAPAGINPQHNINVTYPKQGARDSSFGQGFRND